MNIGMLWYDNDKTTTIEQKIEKAVAYYQEKYGKPATCVFVSKNETLIKIDGIDIQNNRAVLPDHLWVGVKA